MDNLICELVNTRLNGPMTVCGNHAAYLVRSGQQRYCFKWKSKLRREPP